MAGEYFCIEEYPTGGTLSRSAPTLIEARTHMRVAILAFLGQEHMMFVKKITFIIGKRTDDPVTGFAVIERYKISRDKSLS